MSDTFIIVWLVIVAAIAFWLGTNVKCTVDTFAGGQICVKNTCLDEDDIKRVKALPTSIETKSIHMDRWHMYTQSGNKAFILRDTKSPSDARYAFPERVFKNLATGSEQIAETPATASV